MRQALLFIILSLSIGCVGKSKAIKIYDDNNQPLSDAFIVVSEQRMMPINKNEKFILKSDSQGNAEVNIQCLSEVIAGKKPFYPSSVTIDSNSESIVLRLKQKYDISNINGVVELIELKTGKTVFRKNKSELWDEWEQYIQELEGIGYFDSIKNKDWFIDEIQN